MALFECRLKPGRFNGKNGRFIKGTVITVAADSCCNGSDIEKAMVAQYGDDAKGCGYIGYWDVRKL